MWKARDTVENRRVALKVALRVRRSKSTVADELEKRGAPVGAPVPSRTSSAIRNADWINGHFVLAAELAETHTWPRTPGAQAAPARIALRVIRDIAAGLAHAHSQRVMHQRPEARQHPDLRGPPRGR